MHAQLDEKVCRRWFMVRLLLKLINRMMLVRDGPSLSLSLSLSICRCLYHRNMCTYVCKLHTHTHTYIYIYIYTYTYMVYVCVYIYIYTHILHRSLDPKDFLTRPYAAG